MAQRIEIQCINKAHSDDPERRIRSVGGVGSDGTSWKLSEDEAIDGIEAGKWAFYVSAGGSTAEVIIATREGHKYLKTVADSEEPDNLLSLPECP